MKITVHAGIDLTADELRALTAATGFSGNTLAREIDKAYSDAGFNAVANLIEKGRMRLKVGRMEAAGELEIGRANPSTNDRRLVRDRSGRGSRRRT